MRNQRTPSPSPSPPHLRPMSPYYSPDYSLGMQYSSQKSSQLKLSQKITKLKHALHSAQSHNEQLHNKAKHYKDLYSSETQMAKQQVKRYKKKYSILQREYEKKQAQLRQLRELMEKETRNNLQSMREKVNRIKELESRVVELETLNFDLNTKLHEKGQKLKKLQTLIEKDRIEAEQQLSRKLARAEKDIQIKSRQCTELHKQNASIKQSLKQQSRKLQKSSLTVYELTCQNKSTIEQHKRSLSVITSLQKTLTSQSQNMQKQRSEHLLLQKQCLQLKTKYDDLEYKYKYEVQKYGKLQGQYEEIVSVYNGLNCRYQQLIMNQYQVHKDLQREINGVAKEIARRYMSSGKGSTAASISAKSVGKKQLLNFGSQ